MPTILIVIITAILSALLTVVLMSAVMLSSRKRMAITLGNIRAIWFTDQFIYNYEHLTGSTELRTARILLSQAIDRLKSNE